MSVTFIIKNTHYVMHMYYMHAIYMIQQIHEILFLREPVDNWTSTPLPLYIGELRCPTTACIHSTNIYCLLSAKQRDISQGIQMLITLFDKHVLLSFPASMSDQVLSQSERGQGVSGDRRHQLGTRMHKNTEVHVWDAIPRVSLLFFFYLLLCYCCC